MFRFITKQSFIVNLIIAIIFLTSLVLLFFLSLGWITNHGSYLQVPSVIGENVQEASQSLSREGFEVVITDSAYNDSLPLDVVKRQLPLSGATVKVNRTVFLNVNPRELPMVQVPKLEGLSYRFATENLKRSNLLPGSVTEKPDFMKGAVLSMSYNGKPITSDAKVRWGSKIDLVIGGGIKEVNIPVPDLIGLTVIQASRIMDTSGLLFASIISLDGPIDTPSAYIVRQNPEINDYQGGRQQIHPGQNMDIWIQSKRPELTDSLFLQPKERNEETRPVNHGSDY